MPELPAEASYVWQMYVDLRRGGEAVTYQALDAYQRVTGISLTPWEAETLIRIDTMRRSNGN